MRPFMFIALFSLLFTTPIFLAADALADTRATMHSPPAKTVVVHSPPVSLGAEEVTSALVSQAVSQHEPVQVGESGVVPVAPSTPEGDDFAGIVKLVVQAVGTRNWSLLAVVGVLAAVYATRRVGASFWPWLRSDVAGVALSFVTAALFTFASALSTGVAPSRSLALGAVLTAASASGLWTWGKKLAAKPASEKT